MGAEPTALPPALALGAGRIGEVTVAMGETKNVGRVEIRYDPRSWIGTMEVGHHAPAVHVLVDRAEVPENAPWGGMNQVSPNGSHRFHLGPYQIDTRASGETPPRTITAVVERHTCVERTVQNAMPGAVSMWLSTEAIRLHTLDFDADMLQVAIQSHAGPRIDVNRRGWRHWYVPRGGETRTFQIDDRIVTIDSVTPGRGTIFDGTWRGDGPVRVHARVIVTPAPRPAAPEPASGRPIACGAPSPTRTTMPPELASVPPMAADTTIATGDRMTAGGLSFAATSFDEPPLPSYRYRNQPPQHIVSIQATPPLSPTPIFNSAFGERVHLSRADRTFVRIDPLPVAAGSPERYRLRIFPLACPATVAIPSADRPSFVWLSTIGHARVTVGTAAIPTLQVQLNEEPGRGTLGVSSEHAYDSREILPALVGHVSTLDGHRLEVVDAIATGGDPVPQHHVQIRISRSAD